MSRMFLCLVLALASPVTRAVRIELGTDATGCVIDTLGGRVISCRIDGREVLWYPEAEVKGESVWRHGGIPLAWPWFGRLGEGDAHIHGYAWKSPFTVRSRTADSAVLTFETAAARLEYTVTVRDGLHLSLRTVNVSDHEVPVGMAFHPYFLVGERNLSVVEGIGSAPIPVTNEVDSGECFEGPVPRREYLLRDGSRGCALRIVAENSTGVNLWNPGMRKACPGVIPGDEWRRFVAVEPWAMGKNRFLVLAPGKSHEMKMLVGVVRPR